MATSGVILPVVQFRGSRERYRHCYRRPRHVVRGSAPLNTVNPSIISSLPSLGSGFIIRAFFCSDIFL